MNMTLNNLKAKVSTVNNELDRRAAMATPEKPQFRVEFRYSQRSKSWEYYTTLEEAKNFIPRLKLGVYNESPRSFQIQKRGSRGGWSKVSNNN